MVIGTHGAGNWMSSGVLNKAVCFSSHVKDGSRQRPVVPCSHGPRVLAPSLQLLRMYGDFWSSNITSKFQKAEHREGPLPSL